jgi:hypothetical protein
MTAPTSLPWRGVETIEAARTAIARQHPVELQLPASFHHAVYACFNPPAARTPAERLDLCGGPELLQQLAQISGLDALAELQSELANAHGAVRVVSPAPTVVITFARPGA